MELPALLPIVFGGIFPLGVAYALGFCCFPRLPMPRIARFAVGAAIESLIVFLLLLLGFANWIVFLTGGLLAVAAMWRVRAPLLRDAVSGRVDRVTACLVVAVAAPYTVLYLVHALAPEIQPDATTYHLGLVSQYVRLGRFPARVGFFEMVPQGLEMLFVVAFAFGKHSAAKLVHFGFLMATGAVVVGIGRRLGLRDWVGICAAAIYFCAPVVGVSGTCAYNDAAAVFFVAVTLYLLLIWADEKRGGYLAAAGVAAGFCFAVKFTGLLITVLGILFIVVQKPRPSWKPVLPFCGGAAAMIAPWMLRNAVMTGNPLAPLFNAWFPNPYFHAEMERRLTAVLRTYGNFQLLTAPLEYTVWGRLHGLIGPVFLLAPIALLTLRNHAGRLLWAAPLGAAIPLYWNVGTRFLMPALPFLAIAIAVTLPRPLVWIVVAVQAVACWPDAIATYADSHAWRLNGFPWEAALRIEPEPHYLERMLGNEYRTAQMIDRNTRPQDRIFCLVASPKAYITRETLDYWHSADAEQLTRAMTVGLSGGGDSRVSVKSQWPAVALRAIRFPIAADGPGEWRLYELRLFSGGERLKGGPQWSLDARPNEWDAAWALDNNRTTSWRTLEPIRRGMFYQISFERPEVVSAAELLCDAPGIDYATQWYGLNASGAWQKLADAPRRQILPREELRPDAVRAVRMAGFTHIMVPVGTGGTEQIGKDMYEFQGIWGVKDVGQSEMVHLFRVVE